MALPLPAGLTPPEIAFLCEMELVTVIPRQRLEGLDLLGGRTPPLIPPQRANLPLWLALLLKRQRRANILPPPWLHPSALLTILELEHAGQSAPPRLPPAPPGSLPISPPFLPSSTAAAPRDALPYHWLELGEILLEAASDDFEDPDGVRRLMRDLREVRMASMRKGVGMFDAQGGFNMTGFGGMEVGEGRAFIGGVIDGLRKIGAARERSGDGDQDDQDNGFPSTADDYDDDEMDM